MKTLLEVAKVNLKEFEKMFMKKFTMPPIIGPFQYNVYAINDWPVFVQYNDKKEIESVRVAGRKTEIEKIAELTQEKPDFHLINNNILTSKVQAHAYSPSKSTAPQVPKDVLPGLNDATSIRNTILLYSAIEVEVYDSVKYIPVEVLADSIKYKRVPYIEGFAEVQLPWDYDGNEIALLHAPAWAKIVYENPMKKVLETVENVQIYGTRYQIPEKFIELYIPKKNIVKLWPWPENELPTDIIKETEPIVMSVKEAKEFTDVDDVVEFLNF